MSRVEAPIQGEENKEKVSPQPGWRRRGVGQEWLRARQAWTHFNAAGARLDSRVLRTTPRAFDVRARPEPNATFAFGVRALEDHWMAQQGKTLLCACFWPEFDSPRSPIFAEVRTRSNAEPNVNAGSGSGFSKWPNRTQRSGSAFGKKYPEPEPNRTLPALSSPLEPLLVLDSSWGFI
ncbi:hypothetical protein C8R46DRAFT_1038274 [Mycena filopes]|nr:hypothetical protein C8R46DRAFT_1038274 [Mycena filopes]